MIVVSGLMGVSMWLIKPVIDRVFILKDLSMLYKMLWLIPSIWLVRGLAFYGQSYLLQYIGQRVTQRLRNDLFGKLMELSHDFYHRNPSGKIISRMTNDLHVIQNGLLRLPLSFIGDTLTVIFLIGLLFYLNFKFALIAFIVFPIVALPLANFAKKMRAAAQKGQKQIAEIYHRIQEGISGISVIKSFIREEAEKKRFQRENEIFYGHQMNFVKVDSRSSPIMEFIGSLAITFIVWYGAMDVLNGAWTSGAFFAFLGAALSIYKPLKNFSNTNALFQQTVVSAKRIFDILDEKSAISDKPGAKELHKFESEIKFDNVIFSYDDNHPVIKNVNFTLKKGEKIAIIGPSGSGKTTLAHLILRFYDVTGGRILIDGEDIKDLTLTSLRKHIALVTQDIVLFNESVKYNIAYGNPDAADDEILEAAKRANAHQFIEKFPQAYDNVVGERGTKLSGGQKQRIAIARAILKNAPLLILDEATSSLDSESEKLVSEALENLMAERTVLMIAHRLSSVKRADRILVIESGSLVEEGTHEELLEQKGIYHRICQLQLL